MKRNKIEILVWMLRNGFAQGDIRDDLNMKGKTIVSETISGKRNHRRVLKWLVAKGCPVKYLDLPGDMREGY